MKGLPLRPTWYFSTKCFPLFSLLSENALKQNFLQQMYLLWQNLPWERRLGFSVLPACRQKTACGKLSGHGSGCGSSKGRADAAGWLKPWGNLGSWKTRSYCTSGRSVHHFTHALPCLVFLTGLHWEKELVELYKAVSFPGTGLNYMVVVFLLMISSSWDQQVAEDAGLEEWGNRCCLIGWCCWPPKGIKRHKDLTKGS